MTRKEAEKEIRDTFTEVWADGIIKALEQEECNDCISRQAVLEYIEGSEAELGHSSENELVCRDIKEFPPVQPKIKVGHWIWNYELSLSTPLSSEELEYCYWACSECKKSPDEYRWDDIDELPPYRYCPNCGTKMESEDKG